MIELTKNQFEHHASAMTFDLSDYHPCAKFNISLLRALRIPDDGNLYPLPPGLGTFPMVHTEDYKDRVPAKWLERQGIIVPIYQSEALWISFSGPYDQDRGVRYPFAVKVAAGKRSALTGKAWVQALKAKDYVVLPEQPWLDGFVVEEGVVRQFVAVPLGMGLTVESQLSGEEAFGGVQFEAYPMKREEYERRFPVRPRIPRRQGILRGMALNECSDDPIPCAAADMGLGAGGQMSQQIYEDPFGIDVWDRDHKNRVFVHLANSLAWRAITQTEPPNPPFTPADYRRHDFPWFDYYRDDIKSLAGTGKLKNIKSILELGFQKGIQGVIPDNTSVEIPKEKIHDLSPTKKPEVHDGRW